MVLRDEQLERQRELYNKKYQKFSKLELTIRQIQLRYKERITNDNQGIYS